MKTLTRAEEQIMQVIWKLENAFLREIINELPNPKPHQNTVSTILKILARKRICGNTCNWQKSPILSTGEQGCLFKGYY